MKNPDSIERYAAPKDPLISIIMVVRNRAELVDTTLDSIRAQRYTNWELLVFDDGSDDGTPDIIRAAAGQDPRIRFFPEPRVGITGKLKNKGISLAQGELLCFMDSDDLWPAQKLNVQLDALRRHPEAGFSFTNGYNFIDGSGEIEATFYPGTEGMEAGDFLERICSGETGVRFPSLMVRKSALTPQNRFRELRLFSDTTFIVRLAQQFPAVLVYEELLYCRKHGSNTSSEGWMADYEEHIETIGRLQEEGALPANFCDRILYKLHISMGDTCLRSGRRAQGRRALLKAWRYAPFSIVPLKKMLRSFLTPNRAQSGYFQRRR